MKLISVLLGAILLLSLHSIASGAPTPINPISPDALGFQMPPAEKSFPIPYAQESAQGLIRVNQQSAYAASPPGLQASTTSPTYNQLIVPPDAYVPNHLYVSGAPQTVEGCYIYAKLPLWMETASSGDIWIYEWFQSGDIEINYAGHAYSPGWFKRWFFSNVPGWHILQFYCSGWSNYVYIYVYGSADYEYWVSPPNPYSPTSLPYVPLKT